MKVCACTVKMKLFSFNCQPRYHNEVVSAVIGELEDRSFTCEQLEIVEIICSKGNELLLLGLNQFLLEESGIRPDQMRVSHQN